MPSLSSLTQHSVLTVPSGRAGDWHQTIRMWESSHCRSASLSYANALVQPIWDLRLNSDYGTTPALPLLEALPVMMSTLLARQRPSTPTKP